MKDFAKILQNIPDISQSKISIPELCEKIEEYLALLHKWNKAYNLTAIRDIDTMKTKHILDSLAILPWINGHKLIDVGSGAGLPGIPIALARPNLQVFLLDSNGKKVSFMQEAKRVLKLDNLEIVKSRVEEYNPDFRFDIITSRAFSSLKNMLDKTSHLISDNGVWVAMKGQEPDLELLEINKAYRIEKYQVEGVIGSRCCVILKN